MLLIYATIFDSYPAMWDKRYTVLYFRSPNKKGQHVHWCRCFCVQADRKPWLSHRPCAAPKMMWCDERQVCNRALCLNRKPLVLVWHPFENWSSEKVLVNQQFWQVGCKTSQNRFKQTDYLCTSKVLPPCSMWHSFEECEEPVWSRGGQGVPIPLAHLCLQVWCTESLSEPQSLFWT